MIVEATMKFIQSNKKIQGISPAMGYIYILSNPSMPGILKIGLTTRALLDRVSDLNSETGVPTSFVVEAGFESDDVLSDEKSAHDHFKWCRVSKNREFFKIPIKEAVSGLIYKLGRNPVYAHENLEFSRQSIIAYAKSQSSNIICQCPICKRMFSPRKILTHCEKEHSDFISGLSINTVKNIKDPSKLKDRNSEIMSRVKVIRTARDNFSLSVMRCPICKIEISPHKLLRHWEKEHFQ